VSFFAGPPTPQDPICQVGTPNFGRIHRVKTSHAMKTRARPIHWFIFRLDSMQTMKLASIELAGLRFNRLSLFPHLFQEGIDRNLKLVPEQIDQRVFCGAAFGGDAVLCKNRAGGWVCP
jgi:hypothetical protein